MRFSSFLKHSGADLTAKYVSLHCADSYWTSIDMPTALHTQARLTLTYDGRVLPSEFGFPMKLRMLTTLGYKIPKHIVAISVTNGYPGPPTAALLPGKRSSELEARPRKHPWTALDNDLEACVNESNADYNQDDVRKFIEMRDV
ncbi:molybdopterin-dependent oxidoreductase [Paraburkholderia panacisoli]|uniref:Molybdopterin-dependent oxidoreductase n=1 Tax=Paraburkholderia panacisoli TaxID=2603818 RepID=A0A5B0GC24_9BURK|nr:molybdopterin-dependent oxidoreductase [Paraburkholderia panacisoli]